MKDILGTPLKIGDVVLYSYSAYGSSIRYYIGEIIRFTPKRVELKVDHGKIMVMPSSLLKEFDLWDRKWKPKMINRLI